jgi:hypothetical protein
VDRGEPAGIWVAHLTRSIRPPQWKGERTTYLKLSDGDLTEEPDPVESVQPEQPAAPVFKACSKCKRQLPLTADHFFRANREKSGFMCCCKDCHKAVERDRYHRMRGADKVLRPGEASRLEGGAA